MKVSFGPKKLEKDLKDSASIGRRYGDLAKRIMMRLEILHKAACLADVPAGPPTYRHLLTGEDRRCFSVHLNGNWRLVFRPNHDPVPVLEDGGINLAAVTAIQILDVVDYHKK